MITLPRVKVVTNSWVWAGFMMLKTAIKVPRDYFDSFIGSIPIDELLANKNTLDEQILESIQITFTETGL